MAKIGGLIGLLCLWAYVEADSRNGTSSRVPQGVFDESVRNAKQYYSSGYDFENGIGVKKDIIKARVLYQKAAELVSEQAKARLKELGPPAASVGAGR